MGQHRRQLVTATSAVAKHEAAGDLKQYKQDNPI